MTVVGIGHSKCLILGGYVVLDHSNVGVCIALNPRVTCTASFTTGPAFAIHVHSLPRDSRYEIRPPHWQDPTSFHARYERFILASFHVFFALHSVPDSSIALSIVGDREFYSDCSKTGLGSSAATTVAIIRSLARLLDPDSDSDRIFKASAIAHSIAQGNVGSCFDISCAVWGSQIFRRPSPQFLTIERFDEKWNNEHITVQLPPELKLYVLNTGLCGSSTPNLVRRFLAKAENDSELFDRLKMRVTAAKEKLLVGNSNGISAAFRELRETLREITVKWEVEIVPDEVQALADRLEAIDGVLAVVIPGAGGYDSIAVFALRSFADLHQFNLAVLAATE
jgi:phosphomevalonate kinase